MNKKARDRLLGEIKDADPEIEFLQWLKKNPEWTPYEIFQQSIYWYAWCIIHCWGWPVTPGVLRRAGSKSTCEAVLTYTPRSRLTEPVLDVCIDFAPATAIKQTLRYMTRKQIRKCYKMAPGCMFATAPQYVPRKDLQVFAVRQPGFALRRLLDRLNPDTIDKCAKLAPWSGLHHARGHLTPYRRRWCRDKLNN